MTPTPASEVKLVTDLHQTGLRLIETVLPPGSRVMVIKSIDDGHTGALVLLCDIDVGSHASTADQVRGQYVLKIENSGDAPQSVAHRFFCERLQSFAEGHVPKLVKSTHAAGVAADLYELAGETLDNLRSAERLDYDDRQKACADAGADLLRGQLDAAGAPDYSKSVNDVMQEWLGTSFLNKSRGRRIREVSELLKITGPVFRYDGELLPNPMAVLESCTDVADSILPCFVGQVHGDLHLRNILTRGSIQTRDLRYWLIDVSWPGPAPLLYDQAYLEMAALIFSLRIAGPTRLIGILGRVDNVLLTVPGKLTSPSDGGVVDLISGIRSATLAVLNEREGGRKDVWRRQHLVARVAAGLNWAAKPLKDDELRKAAFLTSAWAMRQLLREHEAYAATWTKLAQQEHISNSAALTEMVTTKEALDFWEPFHAGNTGRDLILIADAGMTSDDLPVLATCRWAAVIDLDARSDESGLAAATMPALKTRRHVSIFGENQQFTDPASATNWVMANGWNALNEPAAESDDAWRRRGYRARVRALVDEVLDATPNRSVAVMCMRSGQYDLSIDYIADYIDEKYSGTEVRLDLSMSPDVAGIDLGSFLAAVAPTQAITGAEPAPVVPGSDGPYALSREDLNRLAIDLEILHSEVLTEGLTASRRPDDFWRGRPPTWDELEASIDVRRTETFSPLIDDLRKRLDSHQLTVVHLEHSPGAGGTTLARRVAWDLHTLHPTALLRNLTSTTVERIDEIFQATGKAVLLVAEAADLPESSRDELINGLQQRNSRAVVLWVNRTNSGSHAEHKLLDPVTPDERRIFVREYSRRAKTDHARQLLNDLNSRTPEGIPNNRLSPFYFGLCAYEDEFQGLGPYVQNHLDKLDEQQRKVANYLAMVTRFAQLGVPIDLVRRWLDKPIPDGGEYGDGQLREMLGSNLRHLVVAEPSGLRLLHPLIAHQVLSAGSGGHVVNLAQLAVDFIDDVTDSLGSENSTTHRLLAEIFVRRKSWSEEQQGKRDQFAEIIQSMPTLEGGERVFECLTDRCPDEAHFWNHRGRYHIYRLKGDYRRAEEFVKRAVEVSNSRDPLHLHTLGMVRRFWIEYELDKIMEVGGTNPQKALDAVKLRFDSAMDAFSEARELSSGDYNWVTPVQLITTVVERLMSLSGANNLVEYLDRGDSAADWVAGSLHQAEVLLDDLRAHYAESRTTGKYYSNLCRNLDLLYGNLEALIQQWRELRNASSDTATMGLTLARAIYAQSSRNISSMSTDKLREIVGMTVEAVRAGEASEADLRLWFQAFRRLPEYSETAALEQFSWYASQANSLQAAYYLYILHFLRWQRGDSQTTEHALTYLDECQRLSRRTRNQRSFEWLGTSDGLNPLVHYTELGRRLLEYDNFWERPHLLRRVHGIIDEIKGPRAGRITIRIEDGRFPVFFSPRDKFLKTRDVNSAVEFYLGFSYEGLRAWAIERPGVKPAALLRAEEALAQSARAQSRRSATTSPRTAKAGPIPAPSGPERTAPEPAALEPTPKVPSLPVDPALLKGLLKLAPNIEEQDFQDAIIDLLLQARVEGRPLSALKLGEELQHRCGWQRYQDFRSGPGKLRGAVERLGFRAIPTATGFDVDLM